MKASGAALARRFSNSALGLMLIHWITAQSFCSGGLDEPAGLRRAARLGAPALLNSEKADRRTLANPNS